MAGGVITTGNNPKALWPGIQAWFGAAYDEHPVEWTDLFEVRTSRRSYEELVLTTGFGLAPVKPQGTGTQYDSESQGFTKRFTNVAYSLGFIVSFEEFRDNLYREVGMARSQKLAFSMRQTKENVGANVYNRATDSNYTGGDGKELLATDHPTRSGDQSNELSTAADMSEAAIEDLCIQIMQTKNDRGMKISIMPRKLLVPPQLAFEAERILKSTLQNDTANNAINAIRSKGVLPEGYAVNHYFTDPDQWFIRTNCPNGMILFDRDNLPIEMDNDFDTKNGKYKKYERYVPGWADWRGLFGSPGA